jgi:hypothetical protein
MSKKGFMKIIAAGCIASLLLTGCGSTFPEMTEEEYNQTVQYAVGLLMKYSNNGVERLSSISALEMQHQIEKEEREAAKAERDAQLAENIGDGTVEDTGEGAEELSEDEELVAQADDITELETEDGDVKVDISSEDGSEDDNVDELLDQYEDQLKEGVETAENSDEADTADSSDEADSSEEADASDSASTEESVPDASLEDLESLADQPTEETLPTDDSSEGESLTTQTDETVDGMRQEISKGMFLTYSGYSVVGSYADERDVFSITATKGNKLLVLNFKLINTSGMDVSVDMVKANPHFQIILNGTNVGYTNVTMLDNDLSSFAGTIPAGAKQNMVLIKQMNQDKVKTVDTLGLIGTLGGDTITFNLE